MMYKAMLTVALIHALSVPDYADAQKRRIVRAPIPTATASAPVDPAACNALMRDYDNTSKKLAFIQATDAVDDNPAQTASHDTQTGNAISESKMALDLMKANGCKMPTYIPSASRYGSAGLACSVALQKARTQRALDRLDDRPSSYGTPLACVIANWVPDAQ